MELSRLGVPVRLIDKRPGPSARPRLLVVHSLTAELLEQRGLHPLPASQAKLERMLREQLARQGVAAEYGTELIALAQAKPGWRGQPRGSGVTAQLRHHDGRMEDIAVPYLISADGTTGQLLNLRPPPPLRHGRVFFGADFACACSPATGQGREFRLPGHGQPGLEARDGPAGEGGTCPAGNLSPRKGSRPSDQLEQQGREVIPDYWSSPLSAPPRGPGRLQPGGSVPDMRVLTWDPGAPAGPHPRSVRLHELVSPSRLNLLIAGDTGPAGAPRLARSAATVAGADGRAPDSTCP